MSKLVIEKHNDVVWVKQTAKFLNYNLNVYFYLVDGLLVDTGPHRFKQLLKDFFQTSNIEKAVLTHYHEDHSGNAAWLQRQDIPIFVNRLSVGLCQKDAELPLYRRFFWGRRNAFEPSPLGETIESGHSTFEVVETPGHCFDHVTIYNGEKGILFTGDLIVTPNTKVVLRNESIPSTIASLKKLLCLNFKTIYCAHAGPIENGRQLVQRKLDHLESINGEVQRLHQSGLDVAAINKKLFPEKPLLTYLSRKEWASEHIITSIINQE